MFCSRTFPAGAKTKLASDGSVLFNRWLIIVDNSAEIAEVVRRGEVMQDAAGSLQKLGAVAHSSRRFLYNAANPIGEECSRDAVFTIR